MSTNDYPILLSMLDIKSEDNFTKLNLQKIKLEGLTKTTHWLMTVMMTSIKLQRPEEKNPELGMEIVCQLQWFHHNLKEGRNQLEKQCEKLYSLNKKIKPLLPKQEEVLEIGERFQELHDLIADTCFVFLAERHHSII